MEYTEILISIRKILRSINLESKKIQKEYGVSIPQLMCLDYLGKLKELKSTQVSIANYLNLNSSTMSGIIDRLELNGLVARLPNTNDKRTVFISLTSKGSKLLNTTPPLLHQQLASKLDKLPKEKIIQIKEVLEVLVDSLGINQIPASPILTIEEPISTNLENLPKSK